MSDPIPYIARGSKAFSAILIALFFAGFTSFSVLYYVQPMMPIFAQYFQISPTQSSFPLSLSTVALAVGLLFTGMISDRFGRKPIMLWALLLCSSLTILSSFVQMWPLYLLFRVLIGLCVSGVAAVAMTYIGEEIAREDLAFAMGLYISGTAVGGMSGRLLAGVMIDFLSWQQATLIIGLLNFCLAIAFWKLLPNSRHFSAYPMHFSRFIQSFAHNLADRKLRILFVQAFILMGCFVTIFNYMSYHLLEAPFQLSQTWIGLISIVYLAGIYSSPRAAAWSRCFGREKVLPVMLCSMIAGLGIMMLNQIWLIFIGLLIFTFSFFAAHSTASAWVSVQAVQYRAVASSLYLFCYYLGSSILGSSSGVVWENFGWHGIGTEISLILAFGLLLAFYLARGSRT